MIPNNVDGGFSSGNSSCYHLILNKRKNIKESVIPGLSIRRDYGIGHGAILNKRRDRIFKIDFDHMSTHYKSVYILDKSKVCTKESHTRGRQAYLIHATKRQIFYT